MSVIIEMDMCIGCNLCVPVCPNRAIAEIEDENGAPKWLVKADLCSECKDEPTNFYETHQCITVCPMNEAGCIVIDPNHQDDEATLHSRGKVLGDYRQSIGLPRNYSYADNQGSGMEPAPGEFGPHPNDAR